VAAAEGGVSPTVAVVGGPPPEAAAAGDSNAAPEQPAVACDVTSRTRSGRGRTTQRGSAAVPGLRCGGVAQGVGDYVQENEVVILCEAEEKGDGRKKDKKTNTNGEKNLK